MAPPSLLHGLMALLALLSTTSSAAAGRPRRAAGGGGSMARFGRRGLLQCARCPDSGEQFRVLAINRI